jgi:hypothetical protein
MTSTLITKRSSSTVGEFEFIFSVPDTLYLDTTFEIVDFGPFGDGGETEDDLTVYPSAVKITISDFEWKNFNKFDSQVKAWRFNQGRLEIDTTITVKYNGQFLGKYIITDVEQNLEEFTLDITITSGSYLLKEIRIDNPYLIKKLQSLGFLEPEVLKNSAGVDFQGWAFGEIAEFFRQTLAGFVITGLDENGNEKTVLRLSFADVASYPVNTNVPANVIEKQTGKLKIIDFIKECLKVLNPDVNFKVKHDWTFGTHNKKLEDLWAYQVYRSIFGRVVIISRAVYNTLHPDIWYSQALRDAAELIWRDDTYVAWRINSVVGPVEGIQSRTIMDAIKIFCSNFNSTIYFKDFNNVIFYKRSAYIDPGFPNPFGGGDGLSNVNIKNIQRRHEDNQKKYIEITWQNNKQRAFRGEIDVSAANPEETQLRYPVMFSAAQGTTINIIIPGIGGLSGSSIVVMTLPANGNLFYIHENKRYYAITVKDPSFPGLNKLIEILAESEYQLRKNARPKYDIEAAGFNFDYDAFYTIYYNETEIVKARPIAIEKDPKTYLSNLTMIKVL